MTFIKNYQCSFCQKKFTDQDIQEKNYQMSIVENVKTSNEKLKCVGEGELKIIHRECKEIKREEWITEDSEVLDLRERNTLLLLRSYYT
ncbi:hypothetical protein [endosymbiont GvMRE of Glomus versiforme]|uniref:hypothetical protein n=1 Tax=endosymbiont GvMRE of Glomus versiforme TaxID=2039283 RepID=UPI0011C3C393|nr:hypothetical protein [endosymbiont GvMRE of Glomus versiforme]